MAMSFNTDELSKAKATAEMAIDKAQHRGHEIISKVVKVPAFSYVCLQVKSDAAKSPELDILTVRSHVAAALTQFLGLTGSAISLDILKVDQKECWIRVPRDDLSIVVAALGGWTAETEPEGLIGWQVKAVGNWLSVLTAKSSSQDLWNDHVQDGVQGRGLT